VSKDQKASDAADLLEEAANIYKSQNMHKEAADCFVRSSTLMQSAGKAYEAAGLLKMAGIQLKLAGDDPTSKSMLGRAVDVYSQLGKGHIAAKLSQELGTNSEQAKEYDDALVHYVRAADLYKGEGQDTQAHQCMEKVAHAYAVMVPPDYFKAAAIFEELGINALNSRLGRYSARKFFFRAVLCTMATSDTIGARAKHTHFQAIDCQFSSSQESKFLNQLIIALEVADADQFSKAYRGACVFHIAPYFDARCVCVCALICGYFCFSLTSTCKKMFGTCFVCPAGPCFHRLRNHLFARPVARHRAATSAKSLDRRHGQQRRRSTT
jgi:alpha-soluble NSF attachment protein